MVLELLELSNCELFQSISQYILDRVHHSLVFQKVQVRSNSAQRQQRGYDFNYYSLYSVITVTFLQFTQWDFDLVIQIVLEILELSACEFFQSFSQYILDGVHHRVWCFKKYKCGQSQHRDNREAMTSAH